MTFQQLLYGAEVLFQSGNPKVTGVEYDSRRVQKGSVFVAMKGETSDGNRYIDQAISAGAVAVVTDSPIESPRAGVAWAQVAHGRCALARLSANFCKHPAERIANIGITGTNGKSTTAFLIESILHAAARKTVLIGTIEYHVAGNILPAPHTTPEALELNRMLAEGLSNGATESVMEVSSHALEQERIFGIPFDVAVFTNLTRDHLDCHGTMEEYFRVKQVLFHGCGTEPPRAAVINIDDEYGRQLLEVSKKKSAETFSYGINAGDFHADAIEITARGTRFHMITPEGKADIWSPLIGKVNVYNILAASAAGYARLGSASARATQSTSAGEGAHATQITEAIAKGVFDLTRVPGRFERVDCGQPFTVAVDYAHTDDALRNMTALAREFVARAGLKGKVITLFGCGGDRDRTKRPLMGEAAGKGSHFVVLTSDNPRSEDPLAIMNDAMVGLQKSGTKYAMEPDRRKAISIALKQASPGDIVLLAGKGHEKVQVSRDGTIPFDDVEVAREILAGLGYGCQESVAPAGAGKSV
jgi:UDP-N-acetylmuramoyl-L-alanyl-D-glutamate--2,6-diaminopimelate ligase